MKRIFGRHGHHPHNNWLPPFVVLQKVTLIGIISIACASISKLHHQLTSLVTEYDYGESSSAPQQDLALKKSTKDVNAGENIIDTSSKLMQQQQQQPHFQTENTLIKHPRICKNRNDVILKDSMFEKNPNQEEGILESQMSSPRNITWVMFMGDSNMRHTYHWWTWVNDKSHQENSVYSSTYGLDRRDLDFGGRWADQEILYLPKSSSPSTLSPEQPILRYSFRFLHGSITEFDYDAQNWDIARQAVEEPRLEDIEKMKARNIRNSGTASILSEQQQQQQQQIQNRSIADGVDAGAKHDADGDDGNSTSMLWEGRIRPSDYALWATQNQQPIENDSKEFNSWMKKFREMEHNLKKSSPDVVIVTQGWGGVPRSDEVNIVRNIVQHNPETLFVWSPVSFLVDPSSP